MVTSRVTEKGRSFIARLRLAAVAAGADDVEPVALGPEAGGLGHLPEELVEALLEPVGDREVLAAEDLADDARLDEHRQVPVGGALGRDCAAGKHLGDGHGPARRSQDLDESPAAVGVALVVSSEMTGDRGVKILFHRPKHKPLTCFENRSYYNSRHENHSTTTALGRTRC